MASINVTNVVVLDNPTSFTNPFQFEITFECLQALSHDLEWKLTYVGSADSEENDQELDSVLVGPVPLGVNRFVFQAPCPDSSKIPDEDLIGVTIVLISCCYRGKEFLRIGYYVNNNYDDPNLVQDVTAEEGMDINDSEGEEDEDDDDVDGGAASGSDIDMDVVGDENSDQKNGTTTDTHVKDETEKPKCVLPKDFDISKIKRVILDDKPRVTRFHIDWDDDVLEVPQIEDEGL